MGEEPLDQGDADPRLISLWDALWTACLRAPARLKTHDKIKKDFDTLELWLTELSTDVIKLNTKISDLLVSRRKI